MHKQKKVVVISPENVKENLSPEEWLAFLNTIDKLLRLGIEPAITYEVITVARLQS